MKRASRNGAASNTVVFEYPMCESEPAQPSWDGWREASDEDAEEEGALTAGAPSAHGRGGAAEGAVRGRGQGEPLAEERRRSFEAGRGQGQLEGRQAEREAHAAALKAEQERHQRQLAALVRRFTEEGEQYLHAVEQEVVKLALAVAARILRREAQMDPLLLTGAVRVALGQLAAASEVRLHVPAADVDLWTETMALVPKLAVKPVVVAGEEMRVGDCVIESQVGTVDLGVRAQLGEIERGFFDRAQAANGSGKGSGAAGNAGEEMRAQSEARA